MNQLEDHQQREFQGRLDRIQTNRISAPLGSVAGTPKQKYSEKTSLRIARNSVYPLSIIGAFFLGMLSVVIGQFVRVNLIGIGQPDQLWLAVADLLMATMIIFSLRSMFHLPLKELVTAQTIGIVLMFLTLHNLVHVAPFPFAVLMSPEWVDHVVSASNMGTLRMGSVEIQLFDMSAQASTRF